MPGHQRIHVVSSTTGEVALRRLRDDLGRKPVVLAAPTTDAARAVRVLEAEPQVESLLAPASSPEGDRGHQLDALVRRYALDDRYRDVVVVTDTATSTLLVQALAPDQPFTGGEVTVVGLPRGERQTAVRRGLVSGLAVGVVSGLAERVLPILALPGVVALVGLALLLSVPWRHLGRELLLSATVAAAVVLVSVASSARFPGAW